MPSIKQVNTSKNDERKVRVTYYPSRFFGFVLGIAAVLAMGLPRQSSAQDVKAYFRNRCYSCHTIGGGRLSGPDLKNVSERQSRDWLVNFLQNPKAVIDQGDPYAQKLVDQFNGVVMPTQPDMTEALANDLLDFIKQESQKEESEFIGAQISDRPFTPQDVQLGKALFQGRQAFENQGAACISCHSVKGLGSLGGGWLGPDLTQVYGRLQGRAALGSWLMSPQTPTMKSVFQNQPLQSDEVFALLAYFENRANQSGTASKSGMLSFFLLGTVGASIGLAVFDQIWRQRLRGVRKSLIKKQQRSVQL